MHDIYDPRNQVNRQVVESPELLGKECRGCARILEYSFFERDHSYRDGRRDLCVSCASVPRLSVEEHTLRLREKNLRSEALKRQRPAHQEDYKNEEARRGRLLHHSELLCRLQRLVPDLYVMDGNIVGDLAVFRVYPGPQKRLGERDFEYLFYMPTGWLTEFDLNEFDNRDVLVRAKQRGWRTVLLRLIRTGMLTHEQCDREFGQALGPASTLWYRTLWEWRNHKRDCSKN